MDHANRRRITWAGLAILLGSALSCGDDGTVDLGEAGDPSEDTLSVALAAAAADETVLLNARGTWWVWDQGGDLGTAWRAPDYVETGWKSLRAPLGYGESYVTPISYGSDPNHKHITTYFRKKFFVDDAGAVQSLRLEVMYDDGFVFYLNGQEGGRAAMPSGIVTAGTLSTGHEANNAYVSFDITSVKGALVTGWNMLAVEVHQQAPSSSDLVFDASVIARLDAGGPPPPPEEGGFDTNSTWSYWDRGGDLGTAWRAGAYDDSGWRSGGGPLGYGESYLRTTVAFGPSSSNKFITTYFRKKFIVDDPSSVREMRGAVMYDDGFVVYLNGQEIQRASIPAGSISASTRASDHEAGNRYEAFPWDDKIGFLVPGENVVAVEVHQSSSSSSDLVFDLGLVLEQGPPPPQVHDGIGSGSVWYYHDEGPLTDTGWRSAAGAGPLSGSGPGPLGYGERYVRTTVSFGSSASNKHITTYFRHEFAVQDVASILRMRGSIMYDDGAVVYLNGQEIQRLSMPSGAVGFSTRAFDHEARNLYEEFDWTAARGFLREGRNFLAVEVHQADPASSDLVFDLALTFERSSTPAWFHQSAGVGMSLSDLSFVDSDFGWVVGGNGTILHTRSGGNSWSRQISGTTAELNGVSFANRTHGWVVGSGSTGVDGGLWSTTDGGARWTRDRNIPGSYNLLGVHFISPSMGWAVGHDQAAGTSIVLSTTDGGISWTVRNLSGGLRTVVFADENHGWIAGLEDVPGLEDETRAVLFHTSDGGATWVPQDPGPESEALHSVTAVSATRAWAAGTTHKPWIGDGWSALRTTDGGSTWTSSTGPVNRELFGISFVDAMNGWVAGAYGTIAATQDGGATWATQVDDSPRWYLNVEFVDATTGWVIGENGTILKTVTGGR